MTENRVYSTFELQISRSERNIRKLCLFSYEKDPEEVFISFVDFRPFGERVKEFNLSVKQFIWFINNVCYNGKPQGVYNTENEVIYFEVDNVIHDNVLIFAQTNNTYLASFNFKEMELLNSRKANIRKYAHCLSLAMRSKDDKSRAQHIKRDISQVDADLDLNQKPENFDFCC